MVAEQMTRWSYTPAAVAGYMRARHYHQRSERMVQRAVRELAEIAKLAHYRTTDTHGRELWRRSTPPKLRFIVRNHVVLWIGSSAPPADVWTPAPADVVVPLHRGLETRPSRAPASHVSLEMRIQLRERFGARVRDELLAELQCTQRPIPAEAVDHVLRMLVSREPMDPRRYLRALLTHAGHLNDR